jgi:UDP-3-O-[3-hydroxymyristoyl] glucosamine N-acyltransferase
LAAKTGVMGDISQENSIHQGIPAMPIMDYKKSFIFYRKLPQLASDISLLQKDIDNLKSKNS